MKQKTVLSIKVKFVVYILRFYITTLNKFILSEKSNKIIPLKSKSIGNTGLISSKGFSQSLKSKGLSIRSESELNVFIPNKSKSSSAKEVKLPEKKTASADQKLVPSMELSKVINIKYIKSIVFDFLIIRI